MWQEENKWEWKGDSTKIGAFNLPNYWYFLKLRAQNVIYRIPQNPSPTQSPRHQIPNRHFFQRQNRYQICKGRHVISHSLGTRTTQLQKARRVSPRNCVFFASRIVQVPHWLSNNFSVFRLFINTAVLFFCNLRTLYFSCRRTSRR